MRALILATLPALALAGCGKPALELPADPIERAATCGVVAAAKERTTIKSVKGALPVESQGRILHHALLAGAEGKRFDSGKADAVVKRMPAIQEEVTEGKWQALAPECAAAYPATAITAPTLPAVAFDAQLDCYMLADFLKAPLMQDPAWSATLSEATQLTTRLEPKVSPKLNAVGAGAGDALRDRRAEALSAAAKLGQPIAVLKACVAKYG